MPKKEGAAASRVVVPPPVGPDDLDTAKREALLQLRIGRAVHLSAIFVSGALALDAALLLFVFPAPAALPAGQVGAPVLDHSAYLLLPILAGLVVSAVGLAAKWEAFQFWPWEAHFSASVAALGLNVLAALLYGLRVAGDGPFGHVSVYPLFVPLILGGIGLALLAVVLTWRPWGAPQWTSGFAAVAPLATVLLLWVHPSLTTGSSGLLAVAFLASAVLYQTSGSFVHLVSSGTEPHERAIVLSGQHRIVRLASEVSQRDSAIRYRESALVKREADVESAEAALRRNREAGAAERAELEKLEEQDRLRSEGLDGRERDLAGREAALEARGRSLDGKAGELELRLQQQARTGPDLTAREERLARAEGERTRREVELQQRVDQLGRRETGVAEGEQRLEARRKEIDQKTADLLRREGEVTARESAAPGAAGAGRPAAATADLAAREARVQHLKTLLDEQNVQLGRRAKEVAEAAKTSETALRQIVERQAALAARETALSQREADADERRQAAESRRLALESALQDYQRRLDELGRQQVAAAQKGAEVDRSREAVAVRERTLSEREARLRAATTELDRREGEIVLRERAVDADEAEVSLRRQEMGRGEDLPFAGLLAVAAADRVDGEGPLPSRAMGRRRTRAPPPPEAPGIAEAGPGLLSAASVRRFPDRLPTGTPRLDDLLLGGLPPKSHVVLVGDAFSGKEVLLYAFIAEGLKRSEPAVLVTASRSTAEVADSLGVVLPQFRSYEQMGNVTWIDASGSGSPDGPHRLVAKSSDDRAGILTALVEAAKRAEEVAHGGPFRVAFFGLSAVFAHADERASFSFLQNVVGILKPRSALAMYALEAGALSEAQVEALLGRMDGAIVFRDERDRSYLAVKGFGEVATRDWIEVRATARSLTIGSFALERIR